MIMRKMGMNESKHVRREVYLSTGSGLNSTRDFELEPTAGVLALRAVPETPKVISTYAKLHQGQRAHEHLGINSSDSL